MSLATDPIAALGAEHRTLGETLLRHQEALIERRLAEAASLLEAYERELLRHMAFEERHLLARCLGGGAARWPSEVYRAEHRRIRQLLRRSIERLTRARAAPLTAAGLIALLDEERTLKRLVEHHHEREEQALFVELGSAGAPPCADGDPAPGSAARSRPDGPGPVSRTR